MYQAVEVVEVVEEVEVVESAGEVIVETPESPSTNSPCFLFSFLVATGLYLEQSTRIVSCINLGVWMPSLANNNIQNSLSASFIWSKRSWTVMLVSAGTGVGLAPDYK
ncbi:hypothetical protein DFA_00979 [Cavenderia fasciculata]|uniref:Uncharacterized protein n=1 Tax=Cavenderia fasciculata TaxID=261658 RepID=F4PUT5_CACFS|nr:uncharacterized protein DFA_00979 [Cavenderia fasciculata]EGG21104.1 hypothetical protein DFA_00979 [Cavenderia fasciculata]|eukprot:XP_004358954.1 hypothetical protein DFA_00979 [Cavenderia fasciculata]